MKAAYRLFKGEMIYMVSNIRQGLVWFGFMAYQPLEVI